MAATARRDDERVRANDPQEMVQDLIRRVRILDKTSFGYEWEGNDAGTVTTDPPGPESLS
jgi:hypothetical protein